MKPILFFLCREYEENGEIKKETKYTYSKLINKKSILCSLDFCVCVFWFCCKPFIFFSLEKKDIWKNSKNSVS